MAGTSGVIFPVKGLQRAARYLVSKALMIFWMVVRSSSRVSKKSFFVRRCILSALAIWVSVPAGFGTRMPGFGGWVNGLAGAMQ